MAILRPADPDAPLQQGDLLDDVLTATTDGEGPQCSKPGMVLVVSRNCQAIRSGHVVVARVVKTHLAGLKEEAETLEHLIGFFTQLRDGDGRPDTFYLGELDSTDRYAAKFDQLFTIKVPESKEDRATYLSTHRRFSLTTEFIHDLHQRLFRAFASLGFDDDAWFTNADLKLIVGYGESQLTTLEAEIGAAKSRLEVVATSGGSTKEEKELNRTLTERESKVKKLKKELGPLIAELQRRLSR